MVPTIRDHLILSSAEAQLFSWDEITAGSIASNLVPAVGRFPYDIGSAILSTGMLHQKFIKSAVIDIVYQDSPLTNEMNNEIVYQFGNQLEHLFDPLAEYSPEQAELLYSPPTFKPSILSHDNDTVQSICQELFSIQSHFTNNLLSLIQDYIIPLRLKVLDGEVPGINIQQFNLIFPPTIDEVVRINTIFYEALEKAIPYGSFETMKACGISIPYFYKACMRHEAATRNFSSILKENLEYIQSHTKLSNNYTSNRIESAVNCSLHLIKIKLILDRLRQDVKWTNNEKSSVEDYYNSAVGTIHSFGRENFISPYDNRVFTPTGKLLVEIAKGWPKELEYGWIDRRVVTIFDAINILNDHEEAQVNVIFIFTDSMVILQPRSQVETTDESGIHKPSIADILMHSMINSVPLPELPELDVVGWAPIKDVYISEFESTSNVSMMITGDGLRCTNKFVKTPRHLKILRLLRPDMNANKLSMFVSKARIMNKSESFHLFYNKQPNLTTFGTVHEINSYMSENRKNPIAMYLNMEIPDSILDSNELIAGISAQMFDETHILVKVISKLDYDYQEIVPKYSFAATITEQITRIYSMFFSSTNPIFADIIIENNTFLVNHVISFATSTRFTDVPLISPKTRSSSATLEKPASIQTLRQRVSSASSVLTRFSRSSQETKSTKSPDLKKRFSFFGKDKVKGVEIQNTESAQLPTVEVKPEFEEPVEKQISVRKRFSFPTISSSSRSATPLSEPTSRRSSMFLRKRISFALSSSPEEPEVSIMTQNTEITNATATTIHNTSSSESRKPSTHNNNSTEKRVSFMSPEPIITVHSPFMSHSSANTMEIVSLSSSAPQREIWDNASEISLSKVRHSTPIPSETSMSTLEAPHSERKNNPLSIRVVKNELDGQRSENTPSSSTFSRRFSENYEDAISHNSPVHNWFSGNNRRYSQDSFDTISGTSIGTNETSLDEHEVAPSLKNITSFMDSISINSSFRFPIISSQAPQLPPITFDDLTFSSLLPSFGKHKNNMSSYSADWKSIADTDKFLHAINKLRVLTHEKNLDQVRDTVVWLNQCTESLPPMPKHTEFLTTADQARVVNVEKVNREVLIDCLWTMAKNVHLPEGTDAIKSFLSLEWERRSTMREKLGSAKPAELWSV